MAMLSVVAAPKPRYAPLLQSSSCSTALLLRLGLPQRASRRRVYVSKLPTPPPYPPPPGEQVYQPFRPPPSPIPANYRSLGLTERLEILRDRLGLWHEYATLLPSLGHDGFTPPSIEELTGIPSIEQNLLVVATQVRDSLVSSSFDPELLSYFDAGGGADLLYELRFLNATQRAAASIHLIEHRLDPKAAQELARAMKDFPRRRGDQGWNFFSAASPGDCLAYTYFRLSREAIDPDERVAVLNRAIEAVETEAAKKRVEEEMERATGRLEEGDGSEEAEGLRVTVPIVRLRYGEVAEASTVTLLPVCRAAEGEEGMAAAPRRCKAEGELGVVVAERGWGRWVVLPGWWPVAAVAAEGEGVALEFVDGRVLPWRGSGGWEETVMVVADRGKREVTKGAYYVVGGEGKGLRVERGVELLAQGVEAALGTVVLVVRPPKDEFDDMIRDEDWD
ncbi:rubisco accumulation factor 1, chloroplastic-like [Curcuma longa]|uniref:rubisco accumulation factor 1, chloroplastic-like n=1 Tax=Curcuma longa TaxID=136217 RepID=UPI003D9DCFDF